MADSYVESAYLAAQARIYELEDALRAVRDFAPVTNGNYAVMEAIPSLRKIAVTALASQAADEGKYEKA
jgi:hypothetical protein